MKVLVQNLYRMSSTISEDLLISISMASHKNFKTQQELADHYQQIELITNDTLHESFAQLDRVMFATDTNQNLYGNHLIKLNKRDNMTTPIMHAFPANELVKHITHGDRILDAGTGYGYFALLMASYVNAKKLTSVKVTGIDVDAELIQNCQRIQSELSGGLCVTFVQENILSRDALDYELINIGFGVDEQLVQKIQRISTPEIVHLICPLIEHNSQEQWLTYMRITKDAIHRKPLMKCLFQSAKQIDHQDEGVQEKKIEQLLQQEKELESAITRWNKNFQTTNKSKPTLTEMRQDPLLVEMLKDLKDLKRHIRRAQRPME